MRRARPSGARVLRAAAASYQKRSIPEARARASTRPMPLRGCSKWRPVSLASSSIAEDVAQRRRTSSGTRGGGRRDAAAAGFFEGFFVAVPRLDPAAEGRAFSFGGRAGRTGCAAAAGFEEGFAPGITIAATSISARREATGTTAIGATAAQVRARGSGEAPA